MTDALIGLGSNVGDCARFLDQAVSLLVEIRGIGHVRTSAWHATAPIGGPSGQEAFLNGAVRLETSLTAQSLLDRLHDIEALLGRTRTIRWGPRTIDLDLLLFGGQICRTESLRLPHPRMAYRRFVLEPAVEVAGDMQHPEIGWDLAQLLQHLRTAIPYVAVAGPDAEQTRQLSTAVASSMNWKLLDFSNPPVDFDRHPPSLVQAPSIEFLRNCANQLAAESLSRAPNGVISSGWFDQWLVAAQVWNWPEIGNLWSEINPKIAPPKLLVYLAGADKAGTSAYADALRQRASRPGIGPVLWLDDVAPAEARVEVSAAITAMH